MNHLHSASPALFWGGFHHGWGLSHYLHLHSRLFWMRLGERSVILFPLCRSKVAGGHVTAPASQPDPCDATGGNWSADGSLVTCKLHNKSTLLVTWPGITIPPVFWLAVIFFLPSHYYKTTNEWVTVWMKTPWWGRVVLKRWDEERRMRMEGAAGPVELLCKHRLSFHSSNDHLKSSR